MEQNTKRSPCPPPALGPGSSPAPLLPVIFMSPVLGGHAWSFLDVLPYPTSHGGHSSVDPWEVGPAAAVAPAGDPSEHPPPRGLPASQGSSGVTLREEKKERSAASTALR